MRLGEYVSYSVDIMCVRCTSIGRRQSEYYGLASTYATRGAVGARARAS